MPHRPFFIITSVLGATAVVTGALGAHALKVKLEAAHMDSVWETAVIYHLVHALALFSLAQGMLASTGPYKPAFWRKAAGFCWSVGIFFFAGSLYALALGGPRWLGPVTPLGGLFLIAGWAWVLGGAFKPKPVAE